MGVTITYSGKIKSIDLIPEIVDEFKDICEVMQWRYSIYNDSFEEPVSLSHELGEKGITISGNAGLQGISFRPHKESEYVNLVFNKHGQLSSISLALVPNEGNWIFTKTQFAGIDTHIRVVKLLEYVSAKYLIDFEISDDCQYVEFRDRNRSLEVFDMIDDAMDLVGEALKSIDVPKINKDDNALFKAIEDRIKLFMNKRPK